MKIIKIDAIDSTNIFLKKFVKENNQISRLAVRADYQTKGQGRMNSKWHSEKGMNLTGSIFFGKIKINNIDIFEINKIVCLAVLQVLKYYEIPELKIKWPNDILSEKKKIAGILLEPVIRGKNILGLIIGVGININQKNFEKLPCASSMSVITKQNFSIDEIFKKLITIIEKKITPVKFDKTKYLKNLYGFNSKKYFFDKSGKHFFGYVVGVTNDGKLIIQTRGKKKIFNEKTIFFKDFQNCL
ncbi:MAG: biotin--[acetyl-CoA-carboxylase] ligase [Bacteroidota bacterium]|nr:biotin--[acetyl-CoA-carboxylase] ligase [Bacteroidota bacterium]